MNTTQQTHAAFSLVEVVLALGVASFSLISILGLLPIGLSNSRNSTVQTGAMNLITAIAADIRATSSGSPTSPRFSIAIAATAGQTLYFDEEGSASSSLQTGSRYKAFIQAVWQPSVNETVQRVTIFWPPQAPPSAAGGSIDVVVSLPKN